MTTAGHDSIPDRDYRLLVAGFSCGFGGAGAILTTGLLFWMSLAAAVIGYALAFVLLRGRRV